MLHSFIHEPQSVPEGVLTKTPPGTPAGFEITCVFGLRRIADDHHHTHDTTLREMAQLLVEVAFSMEGFIRGCLVCY